MSDDIDFVNYAWGPLLLHFKYPKEDITKLKRNDAKWKYTFFHNFFFNPNLNENIEILHFSPIKAAIKKIT